MVRVCALVLSVGCGLLFCATANADDDLWFGVKAGTLGAGLEATWRPIPLIDVRAGVNAFNYDDDITEGGIDYDGELELRSFYATLNLRAPLTPFRATAGVFSNGNQLSVSSKSAASYDIGGQTFSADQVGVLSGDVEFDSVAPYVGIGMDIRLLDTLGLNVDLGVLLQGSPVVGLNADGTLANDPNFQAQLENERLQLADDLDKYDVYPVISVGFSWNF